LVDFIEHTFDSCRVTVPAALREALTSASALALSPVQPLTRIGAGTGALPVSPALSTVLPDGLRRGSTVEISGRVGVMSLVLALLGGPSAQGSWSAAVGFPLLSGEAAADYGIELSRFALVPRPGPDWATVVGALLDSMDIVAVMLPRPPARLVDSDARRLAARARQRGSILVPVPPGGTSLSWPTADVRLAVDLREADLREADLREQTTWAGIGAGYGRLQQRQVSLRASGRGTAARPRSASIWLPDRIGGASTPEAEVTPLIQPNQIPPNHVDPDHVRVASRPVGGQLPLAARRLTGHSRTPRNTSR
jgi:hypothetical protein